MKRKLIGLLFSLVICPLITGSSKRPGMTVHVEELIRSIPARGRQAMTGSQFARYVSGMDPKEREQAIEDELLKGNLPEFLRKLVPVQLHYESPSCTNLNATIFVAPDYLAIGSNDDFMRIPMNLHTAIAIAGRFRFVLPTPKMVDAIYLQARFHFVPQPLPAGPEMRSTAYYWSHNQMIEDQARVLGVRLGDLVSGDKKDVVLTDRLAAKVGRIAIYGWHRGPGQPIQPLSTAHGANYADYSHGIRLISRVALINGKPSSIDKILRDPSMANVLSDEGPIALNWKMLSAPQVSTTFVTAHK